MREIAPGKLVPLETIKTVRTCIDFAFKSSPGALALVGWIHDPESNVQGFSLVQKGRHGHDFLKTRTHAAALLEHGVQGVQIARLARPDVTKALGGPTSSSRNQQGFVLVVPSLPPEAAVALSLKDGHLALLNFVALKDFSLVERTLRQIWHPSGGYLLSALRAAHAAGFPQAQLTAALESIQAEQTRDAGRERFATCDQAILLNGRALILNGWSEKTQKEIDRVVLLTNQGEIDLTAKVLRYLRPDLFARYPWSYEEELGFLCVSTEAQAVVPDARLRLVTSGGQSQIIRLEVLEHDWTHLGEFIDSQPVLAELLLKQLAMADGLDEDPGGQEVHLAGLRRSSFLSRHPHLPLHVAQPEKVLAAVERAYPLGEAGILIFGWQLTPKLKALSLSVRAMDGEAVEIGDTGVPLLREDVAQMYRAQLADVNEWSGFAWLVPLPTRHGEARALCFDFGRKGEVWLKVPTDKPATSGMNLVKELLGLVPHPERMRHNLYALFSSGLGKAVEELRRSRPTGEPKIEQRHFGRTVGNAAVSIVVPLYGRADLVRHQLAQFAEDPDFRGVDLIYVVDDPGILDATLELAAKYQALFNVPFRVAWYYENRGFGGANNIGAHLARGEYLVLLNSDVIPRHPGWVATLRAALDSLPDAGAVGPLLQFGDGTIQHAGMYPRRDPQLPGFLLNAHKSMGLPWEGSAEPSEHPMLTAACLMLKKQAYEALGGFDEGYLVGDFEDSDLCLSLRKQGKRLWLVPEAKLWHLERLSQNLEPIAGHRQMLTLYNGWRYSEKIRAGKLADPTASKALR